MGRGRTSQPPPAPQTTVAHALRPNSHRQPLAGALLCAPGCRRRRSASPNENGVSKPSPLRRGRRQPRTAEIATTSLVKRRNTTSTSALIEPHHEPAHRGDIQVTKNGRNVLIIRSAQNTSLPVARLLEAHDHTGRTTAACGMVLVDDPLQHAVSRVWGWLRQSKTVQSETVANARCASYCESLQRRVGHTRTTIARVAAKQTFEDFLAAVTACLEATPGNPPLHQLEQVELVYETYNSVPMRPHEAEPPPERAHTAAHSARGGGSAPRPPPLALAQTPPATAPARDELQRRPHGCCSASPRRPDFAHTSPADYNSGWSDHQRPSTSISAISPRLPRPSTSISAMGSTQRGEAMRAPPDELAPPHRSRWEVAVSLGGATAHCPGLLRLAPQAPKAVLRTLHEPLSSGP